MVEVADGFSVAGSVDVNSECADDDACLERFRNVVDSPVVMMVINSTAHMNDFCNKVAI